jgi:thiol-disulfide isomerase/thioredoxin
MRSLRTLMAVVWLLGMAPAFVGAQAMPSVKDLLGLLPIQKKGGEYETPTDAAAIDACKVEWVYNAQKKTIGVALRDGQGKLLRKFIDSNGNGVMDQWSFFQDGFEVYRESDLNNDKSPDECRWMNAAGTRIGALTGGKIVAWKRISAEEASKVFVQALITGDLPLLETVLATPDELEKLGVPKGEIDQVAAAAEKRIEQVKALQKGLIGWNNQTVWNRLDGTMPHLIPADTGSGLAQDLVLFENAVIFAGPPNGQGNAADMAFLQAPEMVKVGDAWKFVELPRAVDPHKPLVAVEGGIRSWLFKGEQEGAGALAQNPEMKAALEALAQFDNANAKVPAGGDKRELAQFHVARIPLLNKVVKAAPNDEEQLNYNKQIVDSLGAAIQTGFYPQGVKVLDGLIDKGGKLGSYAAFRKIAAEFALRNDEPGANLMANQKKWMADLKAFLDRYPKADEAPDALLQLASAYEFNAEEEEARKYYAQLTQDFPNTEPGKKAAGALRRLDLVGKPLALKGAGLRNESIDVAQLRGKTVLVAFWATWAEPVKRDLPELLKVAQKYRTNGFEIVGVSLDNDRADLDQFLKENPLPWPQIFEPGGMESRLATEYGIISLPTMILVDAQGKVVNRNIRTATELDRQLEKVLANKQPGVALGSK